MVKPTSTSEDFIRIPERDIQGKSDVEEEEEKRTRKRKSRKNKTSKRRKKKKSKKDWSSSSSDSEISSDESSRRKKKKNKKRVVNERLMKKLAERNETLEEREERRAQRRAQRISAKFGYSAESNPFNDPNLHETFTWKKQAQKATKSQVGENKALKPNQDHIFEEIEKVRKRRKDREIQFEEMERLRAEESRMKELENYDEWARKEEEFHLQQQRQRSAIRLIEGREKPIDVMAKNLLMFGLTDEERQNRTAVKYQERYNALNELASLEIELDKPQDFLKHLKLEELEELSKDIDTFCMLESEANRHMLTAASTVIKYWNNLQKVVFDEIQLLKEGGETSQYATTNKEIEKLFTGQSTQELTNMRQDVEEKIRKTAHAAAMSGECAGDENYWKTVLKQLGIYLAKMELSEMHNKMLVRQLERLEKKREEIEAEKTNEDSKIIENASKEGTEDVSPTNRQSELGDLEEELGLTDEIDMTTNTYAWQDKFRPRKPRYFHRVKSGYDWNSYNRTHYDHDNPPPKTVQGYRFNVFYPDLIDKTKTPQYYLEPTESKEFCIIRFSGGPPYEDIAFKIINREW
eukprot:CAMPEP_0194212902 /NCGR_PEP_ID=MMETSP0156-20130528/13070_1 /TAXON_ID=33649 /ORGANISM="Thalassionema nitzschioides, Strain L26-B" /LENGTH=577 /DNA_ID=CAMNT_0038940803 /DNA_START=39 /DNA_END=1769 /DNA_ORIENTATION=-